MKIAIVINKSWNIYNFRMGLINAFLKNGHLVVAIAPEDEYSKLLIEKGCEFVPLEMEEKGSNPVKDALLVLELYKIYKAVSPDFILQYTIKPNIYGTIAANLLGIPCINNVSGLGTVFLHNNFTSRVAQLLYKIAFKYPKKVFFQNSDDLQLFLDKKLIKKEITGLLPGSGVNIDAFKPREFIRNDSFTFLVIARLLYDKGIVEFVEGARIIRQKGINARCQLLGFTDFNTRLGIPQSLLEGWISEGIVEYLGTTDNVASYIYKADCVVLPSYREGTPRTLLEAAALGKPLIATNVPGCKEVVDNDYNGFLCEAKDAEDLANKMVRIYNLADEQLSNFGKNSRKKIEEKFNEQIVFKKYFEALDLPYKN
ncbi:MAG TPA: glycosyltransferase family 4 protein [Cytophagales bacterium]|nr:glycosyltransferase family 4 protein [Cytophagales bacterium]